MRPVVAKDWFGLPTCLCHVGTAPNHHQSVFKQLLLQQARFTIGGLRVFGAQARRRTVLTLNDS